MLTRRLLRRFVKDDTGATAMEYGILAAIMGLGAIAGANGIGGGINTLLAFVATGFAGQ